VPASSKSNIRKLQAEREQVRRLFWYAGAAAAVILIAGALFYHHALHLTWISAFYFCTITLTTVGYGDITPVTDGQRLFTIFYVLLGVGIIAGFVNLMLRNAAVRRQLSQAVNKENQSDS
jgi:voltage-gated potassium channel Kch